MVVEEVSVLDIGFKVCRVFSFWTWLLSGSSWMGWEAFKGLKKFSGGGWWVVESDYSVCPRPLRRFYACITSDGMG